MIDDGQKITYKSFSIHYKTVGKGPVVLLIHGYGYDSHLWDNTLSYLEGFQTILLELPGFGSSDNTERYSLSELAKLIIRWLKKKNIQQYFVLGHSMGGYLALEILSKAPKRLLGIGLLHSLAYADNKETKKNRAKRVKHIEEHGLDGYLRGFYRVLLAPDFADSHKTLIQNQYEAGMGYGPEGFISGMDAMRRRKDRSKKLQKFKKPVLFIVGDEDGAYSYADSLRQLSLPTTSCVHILRKVGHMGMIEAPERFNLAIQSYLQMTIQLKTKH